MFDAKARYSQEGNKVLEFLTKIILNSTYGKTIQKPIDTEIKLNF